MILMTNIDFGKHVAALPLQTLGSTESFALVYRKNKPQIFVSVPISFSPRPFFLSLSLSLCVYTYAGRTEFYLYSRRAPK